MQPGAGNCGQQNFQRFGEVARAARGKEVATEAGGKLSSRDLEWDGAAKG